VPTLTELGFSTTNLHALKLPTGSTGAHELLDDFLDRIDRYHEQRDYPALKGPSYLSTHLRFGTLSIRRAAREAWQRMSPARPSEGASSLSEGQGRRPKGAPLSAGSRGAEAWLGELVWREFFQQLLHHHPRVVGHAFRAEYDAVHWEHGKAAERRFDAWCAGRTGYPLVDAAMRQLNQTGYMHNRLRMVAASFLCKHLGIDWRRGEAYFAEHLNDHELASNNGGWQWAASTGCDAQRYFRIFNPVTQSAKFDAQGRFLRRYLPELVGLPDELIHAPWLAREVDLAAAGVVLGRSYPQPIVDHAQARARTLERYAAARSARTGR
jgi:deoxyribodipyrimidine photo-lyase